MPGVRFFSGGRELGKQKTIAQEIMYLEVQKKGKLDSQERFKFIMKRKLEESRKKVELAKQSKGGRPMSQKAEKALKDIAAKKAAKEQKALRRMVIIQPRTFTNGRLNKKGGIYDIAGNKVGQVNSKDGKIATYLGTHLGYYKPKSHHTTALIQGAIDQWSPYYINMRKMQALQAAGIDPLTGQPLNPMNTNVYGPTNSDGGTVYGPRNAQAAMLGAGYQSMGAALYNNTQYRNPEAENVYGAEIAAPASTIAGTVHGAASNNVWGNFADNAWGTSFDNVWGGNNSDVWGGLGGNPYGSFGKAVQLWGTGNGVNHIKALITKLSQLFGLNTKATRKQLATMRGTAKGVGTTGPRRSSSSSSRPAAGPRSSGSSRPSAPVGRRK